MTKNNTADHQTDVAIVGAGPVGLLLAILLGKQGKKVTLVERWKEVYGRPRAVTMDHEIARVLATLGIDADNDDEIEYHDELYYWKDADKQDLQIVDWKSVSPSGWRVTYWFNQPELEVRLQKIAETFPTINIMRGWQAVDLQQDADSATLKIVPTDLVGKNDSQAENINAKFIVGADGANSFVRETLNIKNVDRGYFFDWLILDMIPQGDYQMKPAQWQLCDPKRPTTIVPGGPRRRRWEFMVLPEESSEEIAKDESAWELMKPWGLTPQNATLERSAVYRFQARWAESWQVGRALITGDAAHLMPPFAGGGMCTGMRDSVSLAWRLNAILDGIVSEKVLESYSSERIPHARHYIDFSQELGNIICIADQEAADQRDQQMKRELAERNHEPVVGYLCQLGEGIWCEGNAKAGEISTQGVVETDRKRDRFDQVYGQGWMVVGYEYDPSEYLTEKQMALLKKLGGRTVSIGEQKGAFDCVDVNGTYKKWMSENDVSFFILRPDFYTAASAKTGEELVVRFDEVINKLQVCDEVQTT